MSAYNFRFAAGAVAALVVGGGAFTAAAQDYSSERAAPIGLSSSGSDSYDSYVADPAESYVTEGDEAPAEIATPPAIRSQPIHPETYERAPYRAEPARPPMAALAPSPQPWGQQALQQQETAPYCRVYFPVGPGRDRSGTLCEQSDGALRLIKAPAVDMRRGVTVAATSQYCREYQQVVYAGGVERTSFGKACWQRDGSWQIVSAPVMAVAYTPAPAPAPQAERRPRLREVLAWLRRDERY